MSRRDNWSYGIVEEDKPKLQSLLDALRRLCQRGLTTGMVAAVFHPSESATVDVAPASDRRDDAGRLVGGELDVARDPPLDEVARRARWMVGSFKQEDIDRVPMRPSQGFEPLVSVALPVLGSPSSLGLVDLTLLSHLRRICPRSKAHRHRSRRIALLKR
jgi:hypothetical protein